MNKPSNLERAQDLSQERNVNQNKGKKLNQSPMQNSSQVQDLFPRMFTYQQNDQILIDKALQDVKGFNKKVQQKQESGIKMIEEEIKKVYILNYQQLKISLQQFVKSINDQIQQVFALNPSYFQEQIEKNKINLKLNIQAEHVTLVWTSINNDEDNRDFCWRKHIYSRVDTANLILKLPSIDFINDINEKKEQDMNKLITKTFPQEYQIKYQEAETEIQKVKQQLQQLSTQQEKDIMLIFAINNIELKFTLSEQLEEQKLREFGHQIVEDLYNKFIPHIIERYYKQSKFTIVISGRLTSESLQRELNFNLGENVDDKTFESIKERRSYSESEIPYYQSICKDLVEVISKVHVGTINNQNNPPKNPDSFIILRESSDKNQFTIVTSKQLIKVNFFMRSSQYSQGDCLTIEVPYDIIDQFEKSVIALIYTILAALDFKTEILDLKTLALVHEKKKKLLQVKQDQDKYQKDLENAIYELENQKDPEAEQIKFKKYANIIDYDKIKQDMTKVIRQTNYRYDTWLGIIKVTEETTIIMMQLISFLINKRSYDEIIIVNQRDENLDNQLRQYFKNVQNIEVPDKIISLFRNKKRLYQTLLYSAQQAIQKIDLQSLLKLVDNLRERNINYERQNSELKKVLNFYYLIIHLEGHKNTKIYRSSFHLKYIRDEILILIQELNNISIDSKKSILPIGLFDNQMNKNQFIIFQAKYMLFVNFEEEPINFASIQTISVKIEPQILQAINLSDHNPLVSIIYEYFKKLKSQVFDLNAILSQQAIIGQIPIVVRGESGFSSQSFKSYCSKHSIKVDKIYQDDEPKEEKRKCCNIQ